MFRPLLAAVGMFLATVAAAHAGPKAAIFPFELVDVSLEGQYNGPRDDEARRLVLATEELRKLAASDAGYDVLDLDRLASEIAQATPLYKCNGCEVELARRIGAETAITGTVRKISNLVLVVHIYVTDVAAGRVNKIHRVELRGNTDETWLRGVRRLVLDHLTRG